MIQFIIEFFGHQAIQESMRKAALERSEAYTVEQIIQNGVSNLLP